MNAVVVVVVVAVVDDEDDVFSSQCKPTAHLTLYICDEIMNSFSSF